MRAMRLSMGRLDAPALTVPQFRALHFVQSHSGGSLSATADFLGLTLPSTSKLVDQLVKRGILARDHDATDRRRMTLKLTGKGETLLKNARAAVGEQLAIMLGRFGAAELGALWDALGLLQQSLPKHPVLAVETRRDGIFSGTESFNDAPMAATG